MSRMNVLTHNARLKLASLALAALTWFFVKSLTSDSRVIEAVPLEVRVRPELAVLETSVATVRVVVRGTREDVRQLSRDELTAVLDLTRDERLGERTVRLSPRSVRASRRVQVVGVEPSELTVNVDALVERELRVEPQLTGQPPAGLLVERVLIKPDTVRIKGPKTLLNGLPAIPTLPIDVTGRNTSFRERVELSPLGVPEAFAQRHWVEADVRIGPARSDESGPPASVDEPPPRGVQLPP
jgi:YbbR domain-containing protein